MTGICELSEDKQLMQESVCGLVTAVKPVGCILLVPAWHVHAHQCQHSSIRAREQHPMHPSGSDAAVLTLMGVCMPCWPQQLGLKQKCMRCMLDEEFDTSCYWHMTAIL